MKIKYQFVTGETVEIEVPDDVAEVAIDIDRDIENSNRKETRRHNSVEELAENGTQLVDDRVDVHACFEQQEIRQALHKALSKLLPQQRELVHKIFFEGRTMADVAREEGVAARTIQDRVDKIKARLKKLVNIAMS